MSKRTGEVTEDYATYLKHLVSAGLVGFFFGVVAVAIGVYTKWYGIIAGRLWTYTIENWIISLPMFAILMGLSYFFAKSKLKQWKTK